MCWELVKDLLNTSANCLLAGAACIGIWRWIKDKRVFFDVLQPNTKEVILKIVTRAGVHAALEEVGIKTKAEKEKKIWGLSHPIPDSADKLPIPIQGSETVSLKFNKDLKAPMSDVEYLYVVVNGTKQKWYPSENWMREMSRQLDEHH